MSYVDKSLLSGETIIKKAKIHWFIYVPGLTMICCPFILFSGSDAAWGGLLFFLGIVFSLDAFIKAKTTELAITNKRVIAKHGFIARKTIELNLSKVESLNVDQGLFGRIFNFGEIIVNGTGGIKTPVKFISSPLDFRRAVNEEFEKTADRIAKAA